MSNIIKLKGKLTTGAPALTDLAVREMCFVIPDNTLYIKKDATNIVMLGGLGLLNSPTFTGTPTAPTPPQQQRQTQQHKNDPWARLPASKRLPTRLAAAGDIGRFRQVGSPKPGRGPRRSYEYEAWYVPLVA